LPRSYRQLQLLAILGRLLILATAAYGFTSASRATTPQPGAASGYTVSNVTYTLGTTNPGSISKVRFTLTPTSPMPPSALVQAKLTSANGAFFLCNNLPADSTTWECAISGETVAAADQLTIHVTAPQAEPKYTLWLPLVLR
jgi:hypothetical protein